ncbi:hypothetical protein NP493_1510g00009 [Ridgeia piscesae]|uniref:DAN domain-containing protein n=1 Tax=Ridgeia piscesae TaxID=27915 RepID=A0AAD9N9Z3_RIDPI|nr:hypothetical protein NP493_1510g00009 [Ridgeia piscesae]
MAFHTSTLMLFILHIVVSAVVVSPMLKTADSETGTNVAGLTDRCRIRRIVHRIEHPGCLSKRLLSFACRGGCESYSQYSDAIAGIERYCSCCQPSGEVLRKVRRSGYVYKTRRRKPHSWACSTDHDTDRMHLPAVRRRRTGTRTGCCQPSQPISLHKRKRIRLESSG